LAVEVVLTALFCNRRGAGILNGLRLSICAFLGEYAAGNRASSQCQAADNRSRCADEVTAQPFAAMRVEPIHPVK
jgi:hypothetical protein